MKSRANPIMGRDLRGGEEVGNIFGSEMRPLISPVVLALSQERGRAINSAPFTGKWPLSLPISPRPRSNWQTLAIILQMRCRAAVRTAV